MKIIMKDNNEIKQIIYEKYPLKYPKYNIKNYKKKKRL